MAAKALVQFLLFAQVLATTRGSNASSPAGSGSLSPSTASTSSTQPSVSPSIPPSQSPSVSPTTQTTSSPTTTSILGSVKPSLSPSSIPTTTTSLSASPSLPVSSIPGSKSPSASPLITPSKAPSSIQPSSSPSSLPSSGSSTPSVKPSVAPSITPSIVSSIPSKASSLSSQPSKPISGSSSPSASPSISPSKVSSIPSQLSKPISGSSAPSISPSKIVSSISNSPSGSGSASKPPTSSFISKAPSSIPSGSATRPSSIPSGSVSKQSSILSKPPSSIPSGLASRSSSLFASGSKISSFASGSKASSIASGSKASSFASGSKASSIASSRISSFASGSKTSSISGNKVSSIASGSKASSFASGSKTSSISGSKVSSIASGSKASSIASGSKSPSSILSGSQSPSGSKPISSPSKVPSSFTGSGKSPISKPTTISSFGPSGSVPLRSSGSGKPSGGSVTKPTASGSGTNGGSTITTTVTKPYGSGGSSSPTGSQPPKSSGGQPSMTGTGSQPGSSPIKPTGTQPLNSKGGQPSMSGTNGSPGSGSMRSSSTGGAIGGSPTSPSVSQTSGGGNGGGSCPTCPSSCPPTTAWGPTATLGCGVVKGTTTSLAAATATVNKFLGVPFAQSPPRRFSPPQKGSSCDVDATAFKPACIQQFVYPKIQQEFVEAVFNNPGGPAPEESEDCLYLNVYAPSSPAPPGGRAVMFWIYGGSLQFGTAGIAPYDGSYFAAYEDVVVVTSNYRTNVFGFATSPEIPVSERNLGFLDQRAALGWVQQNIAAFGGSPEKVTIFGESAGAFSVDALLTSFPANSTPPFRGAILESGQYSYSAAKRTSTVPQWNQLAKLMSCPGNYTSNLACLRAKSASAIKNTIEVNILEFNPVADGVTLVVDPMQQRLSGNIAPIPILAGSNAQEGRVFAVGQTNTTAYLSTLFGNNTSLINTLEAAYPISNSTGITSDYDQSAQIYTELVFQCPAAYQTNATAALGIPAWRYYFNSSFSNTQPYPELGVYHSSEIPLVFSTYSRTNVTVQQYALSRTMRSIWASFAKNPAAGPGWNAVGSGMEGDVLVGADSFEEGGIMMFENGTLARGAYDLGVLGNRGDVLGSGVTIIDQSEVDYRCGLYASTYQKNARIA